MSEGQTPRRPGRTEVVPIAAVVVGERRREDMGDIEGLAASIKEHGLMHPIVVDDGLRLVAGERRLTACRRLGWTEIEATRKGDLSDEELRAMELDENTQRKQLSAYEEAKVFVAKSLPSEDKPVLSFGGVSPDGEKKRGPKPNPRSLAQRAKRVGVKSTDAIVRADRIVAVAEAYPFMQSVAWKDDHIVKASKALEAIPEADRPVAAEIVSQPGIPPQRAVGVLQKLAQKPPEKRAEVVALWRSEDPEERERALTEAAELPPMPDARVARLTNVVRELASIVDAYPGRPGAEELGSIVGQLRDVLRIIKKGSVNGHA